MNTTKRPWTVLNAAMTVDGKIDTAARKGAKISSDGDWVRVDRLRAEVDAVMVGSETLIGEDPRLTVKSADLRQDRATAGRPENPAKVGIISVAEIPLDGKFLNDGGVQVFVFTTTRTSKQQVKTLRRQGVDVIVGDLEQVDLIQAMGYLKDKGIDSLLLEGGGTLNAAMLSAGLVDEIQLYLAPLVFGGEEAPTLADGPGLAREEALLLELKNVERMDDGGILLTYLVPSKT
jgi:2,5-diamino-6-(ribosylamino)-4(3H)-pyrimidinone 5'-phosphate reductase